MSIATESTESTESQEEETDIESEYESDSETECPPTQQSSKPMKFTDLFRWILMIIIAWHIAHDISALALDALLQLISAIESLCSPIALGLSAFPATVYLAYKYLKLDSETFIKHVLCPKCYTLYNYNECLKENPDGSLSVKRCTHIAFPCHPQKNRRLQCSTPLVKPINLSSGSRRLYALHCYVTKSLCDSLQRFLLRKDIHLKLEAWRKRSIPEGHYADVYDGKVWKSFMDSLLNQKRSLAFMINADWFQPFKHCTDSLGAIYLVIMNLPRKERYKRENIILAGLIPSLKTEPSSLNSFLTPLVKELQELWKGVRLYTSESPKFKVVIRGALLCAACDIPAARKLCGFKGHNANHGCSKCFKKFPGPITNKDYSGFDRNDWPKRDISSHRQISKKIKEARTQKSKSELETKYGIYYTVLSELEYFDPIVHCIIDPMHNLFLGTAKRFFKKILMAKGLLSEEALQTIQLRVDSVNVPSTIGRIPKKIATAFGGFTAEQWMNWTLVYSLYALRGLIPDQDYKCWEAFVLACRLLTNPVLTDIAIKKADLLLLNFCRKVEVLYGKNEITPNMHLHCHLSSCIEDYGPVFGFWLYSFERYNGMLGKFPTNQKHIEVQLMQRFETEMQLYALTPPESFKNFSPLLKAVTGGVHEHHLIQMTDFRLYRLSSSIFQAEDAMILLESTLWSVPKRWSIHLLSNAELVPFSRCLRHIFRVPEFIPEFDCLPKTIRCYKQIQFGQEIYSAYSNTRYGRHSYILANWLVNDGDLDTRSCTRPGRIQKIFVYKFIAGDGKNYSLPIAEVEWFKGHANKNMFGVALELWCRDEFEILGPSSFVPIACIKSKFAPAYGNINIDYNVYVSALFICPLRSKIFL